MYKSRRTDGVRWDSDYATCTDFCETLAQDLQPLYLLAFLLAGSHAEAERCFLITVDDCFRAKTVFRGWERSWTRRRLIINSICRVSPGLAAFVGKRDAWSEGDVESTAGSAVDALTRLAPLQRFVFIMSVLERYSELECAVLLGRAPRDVFEARSNALEHLKAGSNGFTKSPERQEQLHRGVA